MSKGRFSSLFCGIEDWFKLGTKSILNADRMGSLQPLFPGGTGWNLSLHAPTVMASISSTWRARPARFFSPYFPTLCRSLHLPLYCEVLAKNSIYGYREGWDQGRGRGRVGLSMPGELSIQGLGWGLLPVTSPASAQGTLLLPASPLCRERVQWLHWGCPKGCKPIVPLSHYHQCFLGCRL
jgi:hypothetical protein